MNLNTELDNLFEDYDVSGAFGQKMSYATQLSVEIAAANAQLQDKLKKAQALTLTLFNDVAEAVYAKTKIPYVASKERRIGTRARGMISLNPNWLNGTWDIEVKIDPGSSELKTLAAKKYKIEETQQLIDAIIKVFSKTKTADKPTEKPVDPLAAAVEAQSQIKNDPVNPISNYRG